MRGGHIIVQIPFILQDVIIRYAVRSGFQTLDPVCSFVIKPVGDVVAFSCGPKSIGIRDSHFSKQPAGRNLSNDWIGLSSHGLDSAGMGVTFGANPVPDPVVIRFPMTKDDLCDWKDCIFPVNSDAITVERGFIISVNPLIDHPALLSIVNVKEWFQALAKEADQTKAAHIEKIFSGKFAAHHRQ
jgi:hypothetical protein